MKLKVTVNDQENNLTLTCTGEIIRGAESEYLFDFITQRSNENIVVDLGSVARIDEDGVVMLVLCRRLLASASKTLYLRILRIACLKRCSTVMWKISSPFARNTFILKKPATRVFLS